MAIAAAALGALFSVLSRSSLERRINRTVVDFATSYGMVCCWPVYLWALGAVFANVQIFNVISAGFSIPVFVGAFLSRVLSLGVVLALAGLSLLVCPNRSEPKPWQTLGPLFAVVAVLTHFFILLAVLVPWI